MTTRTRTPTQRQQIVELEQRLSESEATVSALLSGQIDAVVDASTTTPMLLAKAQAALHDSELRYRRIVETTNQGVWLIDANLQTTFMNRRMAQMFRCEHDMGIGRSVMDFLDAAGRAEMASYAQAGGANQVEVQFTRTDGTQFWALLEATREVDSAGAYAGSFAMIMDITERKAAEAALRVAEARFRRLWESGIVLISITDTSGRIVEVNDAGLEMLGYTRAELNATEFRWDKITPPEWREAEEAARAQLALTGVAPPWEKELLRKDGSRVSVLAASAVIDGVEGIGIAIDVTERKRAEGALRERMRIAALTADVGMTLTHESTLELALDRCAAAIVEQLDVGFARIWTLDRPARMLDLRASAGRAITADDPHLRIPVGSMRVGRIAEQRMASRMDDVAHDSRAGDPMWEGITAFVGHPLLVNDELLGVLGVYSQTPISGPAFVGLGTIADALALAIQRKLVKRANADLEAQLRHSQKMDAVGRLAGGIAHDFNNLLSVILSSGEFLLQDLTAMDPSRQDVVEICKAGTRAAALTRQLLMFSRQQVLEPRVVDLAAATANMEGMLRRVVGEDILVVLHDDQLQGRVRVDPGSIEQVIMNLVVNARDAMPTGGTLTIGTHNDVIDGKRVVVLSIADTGTGMDPATQARIFEPFYTTKEVGKGTGLGLSTVFGIVEQSGGAIEVHSELGVGTRFSIRMPQVDEPADAVVSQPRALLRGSETILLVEDEDQVRAVARAILQRHGYRVIEMRSAPEALMYCHSRPEAIHLLVTDVVMPQMSGPELARQLIAVRPKLRVLCMSGYTDDKVIRHGVQNANVAFLQKPFTSESLTRRVREVLDSAPAN